MRSMRSQALRIASGSRIPLAACSAAARSSAMISAGIGFTSVVFMVSIVAYLGHAVKGLLTPGTGTSSQWRTRLR